MLKITGVRTIPLRADRQVPIWSATHVGLDPRLGVQRAGSVLLVEVETADGLVGLGQCVSSGRNLVALEAIVREFPEVAEFRVIVTRAGALDELALEVETDADGCAARVAQALHARLNLRVMVEAVPPGALTRWELKARRVVDRRSYS